jgi:hypothetical protein
METEIPDTLRRLFEAVIREAEQNPEFARRLLDAAGRSCGAASRPARPARRSNFDAAQLHVVNTLRQHGEAALLGKLEQVKAVESLKAVARASGLVLSGSAAKPRPSRTELIRGIIEAAKHYDAQRSAATA